MITELEVLARPLREEIQEYGALLNLFEDQQTAILQRQPDLVLAIVDAIAKQVELIHTCQKRRKQLVQTIAFEEGCSEQLSLLGLLPHFPAPARPMLEALVNEVNRLIRQTRRRARQNQMLLVRTIELSQEMLRRLRPGTVTKTYASNGQIEMGASALEGRWVTKS
jgi:flagellar biosynthesis/type III secretory pathway chaperone